MKKLSVLLGLASLLLGACQSGRKSVLPDSDSYYVAKHPRLRPARFVTVGVCDGLMLTATYFLIGPRQDSTTGRAAFRYRVRLVLHNLNGHEVRFQQPLRIGVPVRDEPRTAYAEFPARLLPAGGQTEAYYHLTLLAGEPLRKPRFQLNPSMTRER